VNEDKPYLLRQEGRGQRKKKAAPIKNKKLQCASPTLSFRRKAGATEYSPFSAFNQSSEKTTTTAVAAAQVPSLLFSPLLYVLTTYLELKSVTPYPVF
jgi:hypothetical protein